MFSHLFSGSPSWRRRALTCAGCGASLFLANTLFGQAGAASLTFESPEPVSEEALAGFPFFSQLYVYPIVPQRAAGDAPIDVSLIVLDRFTSYLEVNELVEGEIIRERVTTAEYAALNQNQTRVSEAGVLAFKIKEAPDASAAGNGTIGFIRTSTAPSDLARGPVEKGYLTGLSGDFGWDFRAATRTAVFEGHGAHYAPEAEHADSFILDTDGSTAAIRSFDFLISGSDTRRWMLSNTPVYPVGPRLFADSTSTRTYPEESEFYGVMVRSDGWTADDLAGLVSEDSNPRAYLNVVYVLRVSDDQDTDGDGIPDFIDLAQALEAFPLYADFASAEVDNWFYTSLSDDWIHSTDQTPWDYANKFGWTFVPSVSTRNDFWFYGDASQLGWLYTTQEWFPIVYRYAEGNKDGTYLRWISTEQIDSVRRRSVLYNYSSGRFEIIDF